MPSARNTLIKRLALAVTMPLAAIALLEALCTLAGLGHPTRFLIPWEHRGQPVWIDNQVFGYRFFAPAVSRAPAPILVPREKPPEELRVVVLGESAAMGEPEPAYGPARQLEYLLAAIHTNRPVRVINAAMTAINSHVIREIARELPRLKPDYVVLYIGNNEVVGPYGPGTVFHRFAASPALNRARTLATRLRIVSAARAWRDARQGGDREVWRGMEMFDRNRIAGDDPRLQPVYASFRDNLESILDAVRTAGATPVLSTMTVNLDQAPLDGGSKGTDPTLAARKVERDADTLRFRADARINAILRDLAARTPGVLLADAESAFEQEGPPGDIYFIDHVHFTFTGAHRLASTWASAMQQPATLTATALQERLVWNPRNALDIAETMVERAARPPFNRTTDHAERMMRWTREIATLSETARKEPLDELMRRYHSAMQRNRDSEMHALQAVRVLLRERDHARMDPWLAELHDLLPHRADVRAMMAMQAALRGDTADIWPLMTEKAPDLGELPADLLVSASETLLQAGVADASLALVAVAASHFPGRLKLQVLHASRLAQAGRSNEAEQWFGALVTRHPEATWIAEEYGILLAMSGKRAEAEPLLAHLREADDAESLMKRAQWLMFQGRIGEAQAALLSVLDRDPVNGPALRQLALLNYQQGDLAAAMTWAERWAAAEPWQSEAWGQLGDWYDETDRVEEAIAAYEKSIALLADPSTTQRTLAWVLSSVGQSQRALELIRAVAENQQPPAGYTRFVTAAALAASGLFTDAVEEIDRALGEPDALRDTGLAEQLRHARELFRQGTAITR